VIPLEAEASESRNLRRRSRGYRQTKVTGSANVRSSFVSARRPPTSRINCFGSGPSSQHCAFLDGESLLLILR
jgi:hypothetical protein